MQPEIRAFQVGILIHEAYSRSSHACHYYTAASYRFTQLILLKAVDRDRNKCSDKDITEDLDKYQNKCINKYKTKPSCRSHTAPTPPSRRPHAAPTPPHRWCSAALTLSPDHSPLAAPAVGPAARVGMEWRGGRGRAALGWLAGFGRVGPGWPGGGRRVSWSGPIGRNVCTARKGIRVCGVKNALRTV